jgi:hypothetical protein
VFEDSGVQLVRQTANAFADLLEALEGTLCLFTSLMLPLRNQASDIAKAYTHGRDLLAEVIV